MRDPERQGPAAHMAPKVLGKRFRNYLAMFLADMAGRLESAYADLKNTAGMAMSEGAERISGSGDGDQRDPACDLKLAD